MLPDPANHSTGGFSSHGRCPPRLDLRVQFGAEQHGVGRDVEPQHDADGGTQRPVGGAERAQAGNIQRQQHAGGQPERGGDDGAGRDRLMRRRLPRGAEAVEQRHGDAEQADQHDDADGTDQPRGVGGQANESDDPGHEHQHGDGQSRRDDRRQRHAEADQLEAEHGALLRHVIGDVDRRQHRLAAGGGAPEGQQQAEHQAHVDAAIVLADQLVHAAFDQREGGGRQQFAQHLDLAEDVLAVEQQAIGGDQDTDAGKQRQRGIEAAAGGGQRHVVGNKSRAMMSAAFVTSRTVAKRRSGRLSRRFNCKAVGTRRFTFCRNRTGSIDSSPLSIPLKKNEMIQQQKIISAAVMPPARMRSLFSPARLLRFSCVLLAAP